MSASGGLRWTKTGIALVAVSLTVVLTVGLALIVLVYGISTDIGKLQGSLTTTVQAAVAAEFAKEDGVVTRTVQAAAAAELVKQQGVLAKTVQAAVAAELVKQQGVITRIVREAVAAAIDRSFLQESIGNAVEERLGPVVEAKSAEFTAEFRERFEEGFGLDQTKQFPQGAGVFGPGGRTGEQASERPPE